MPDHIEHLSQIVADLQKELADTKEREEKLRRNLDERLEQLIKLDMSIHRLLEDIYPHMYQYRATETRTEKAIEECREIVRKLKEGRTVVINHQLMEMAKYLLREGYVISPAKGSGFICGQWKTSAKYGMQYLDALAHEDTEDEAIEKGYQVLKEEEESE